MQHRHIVYILVLHITLTPPNPKIVASGPSGEKSTSPFRIFQPSDFSQSSYSGNVLVPIEMFGSQRAPELEEVHTYLHRMTNFPWPELTPLRIDSRKEISNQLLGRSLRSILRDLIELWPKLWQVSQYVYLHPIRLFTSSLRFIIFVVDDLLTTESSRITILLV